MKAEEWKSVEERLSEAERWEREREKEGEERRANKVFHSPFHWVGDDHIPHPDLIFWKT